MLLMVALANLLVRGIGIWGINVPVAWGFDIINFVWWIGIGHAGTLISAILLLLRQQWRTSINRFAEAMTLFAVACAGMFPVAAPRAAVARVLAVPVPEHDGRLAEVPEPAGLGRVRRVDLRDRVVHVLVRRPDPRLGDAARPLAEPRRARSSTGCSRWAGAGRRSHWHRYETAYLLLAGLSTPLVVSVHTIVSFDFAVSLIPGWHATIFPPYFVAGAIYAGFAMVLTLAIPLRWYYDLEDFITMRHLDNMARVMLATGLVVAYGYMMETFCAWYSASTYEEFMITNRFFGPYHNLYFALIFCNVIAPQLLWFKKLRLNLGWLFALSIIVSIGMWLERYIIIVVSLHRDFLPSSWGMYTGTVWDWATFLGTLGLFSSLLFLFIRFLPMISIFEMRTMVPEAKVQEDGHEAQVL